VSTAGSAVSFSRELRDICGAEHVLDDAVQLSAKHVQGRTAAAGVEPASAEEVAAVLRFANQHNLSVVAVGGSTQQQTGKPPSQVDILLSTTRLKDVEHYDAGDLTIGVGAGWTVAQLADKVAADGLLFASDPPVRERATIGGLLSAGVTGPMRHAYGGLRDYCIGVRFVTGDGRQGKGGGRVVKNVAGYDMMKLLIGSWGTLAVITGASFKLFPAPRQTRTYITNFATPADAIAFRDKVLRSPLSPLCLELVSPEAGATLPIPGSNSWSVYVRAAGSDAVLARYRSELGITVAQELEGASELQIWRALADFPQETCGRHPQSVLISMSVPLKEVLPILNRLVLVAQVNGLRCAAIGRIGVGHLLISAWGTEPKSDLTVIVSAMRNQVPLDGSSLHLYSAPPLSANLDPWISPTHRDSMRAVKQALDGNDILNRGRFPL